jgi:hypothetical protein
LKQKYILEEDKDILHKKKEITRNTKCQLILSVELTYLLRKTTEEKLIGKTIIFLLGMLVFSNYTVEILLE